MAMTADPRLRRKTIALVGLMGVGKSSIGRRLAVALDLPFRDADAEVEAAAGRTQSRDLREFRRARLPRRRAAGDRAADGRGPHVLATGGGAFINDETRALIKARAISVWLKADLELLARRIGRKDTRPLVTRQGPAGGADRPGGRTRSRSTPRPTSMVETGDTPTTKPSRPSSAP
jgi:shikimate kinase